MKTIHVLALFLLVSTFLSADPIRDFWFAGAEINRYELKQLRYGEEHPGHCEFIFVTEPFLIDKQVKRERGQGAATDILKLNALRTFNTGFYSYRTMTSTFRPIDIDAFPHALKTTTSVQDWCGQAYQQINRRDNRWQVELRSYFQGQGDLDDHIPNSWLEDELWVQLRLNPERLPTGDNLKIVPGALYSRFNHKKIEPLIATATLNQGEPRTVYAITYKNIDRELRIVFDNAFPHIIREWSESGPQGKTTAKLTHRAMNSDYWARNKPKDRADRRKLGLNAIAN